jgi:acryloyl-coenzyme A reductase
VQAVLFDRAGGPEVLKVEEVPDPTVGPGDVLIRVEAAGVCHHDIFHRRGDLPCEAKTILGHEVAGTIEAVGDGVAMEPGTRVVAYNRLTCGICRSCLSGRHDLCRSSRLLGNGAAGGYAELMVIPQEAAIRIPSWLTAPQAALATCPIGTSVRALRGVAHVSPGDTVVITGASGGLGIHQIQIAVALGARPIAITGSPEKVDVLAALGAEVILHESAIKLRHAIRSTVGDRGVDIVIENVTSPTLGETIWTVRPGGTIVVLGNIDLTNVSINPGLLIERRLSVIGSGNPTHEDVRHALALIESRLIRPYIHEVVPFPEADRAHRIAESRETLGRVILSGW